MAVVWGLSTKLGELLLSNIMGEDHEIVFFIRLCFAEEYIIYCAIMLLKIPNLFEVIDLLPS